MGGRVNDACVWVGSKLGVTLRRQYCRFVGAIPPFVTLKAERELDPGRCWGMKKLCWIALAWGLWACGGHESPILQEKILADYLKLNDSLELADLVACAGGRERGISGRDVHQTDVFFYPKSGATDF